MLLMDIGGWTVGLMRLVNGIPNASACRSLELGMIRCIDEAKEQVRRETGLSVTPRWNVCWQDKPNRFPGSPVTY